MQTQLHPVFANDPKAGEAEKIIRSCVHCGFCNATCPTYLQVADERDGPRGRIYLIKQFLETGKATEKTQRHLDRCLSCRSCETTCPSGVEYGRLADISRVLLKNKVSRPFLERLTHRILRLVMPYRERFGALLSLGQMLRGALPRGLREKIPPRQIRKEAPASNHERRVLILGGCVQASATPNTNAAIIRVLDRLGITALEIPESGCCGALSYHLSAQDEAQQFIRRNIDAWRSSIEAGVEGIVAGASGCGVMLKDYGHIMQSDPQYAAEAKAISDMTFDICEVLSREDLEVLRIPDGVRTALHCPCTLMHGQGLSDKLRDVLDRVGINLTATREDHLCCGSAGTYSIFQPELSDQLLNRKIAALTQDRPDQIVTANVGCQLHLATKSEIPVAHWIELLDS